jgi:hypothetical protein
MSLPTNAESVESTTTPRETVCPGRGPFAPLIISGRPAFFYKVVAGNSDWPRQVFSLRIARSVKRKPLPGGFLCGGSVSSGYFENSSSAKRKREQAGIEPSLVDRWGVAELKCYQ